MEISTHTQMPPEYRRRHRERGLMAKAITVRRLLVLCCLCAALLSALACAGGSENTTGEASEAPPESASDDAASPSPTPAPAEPARGDTQAEESAAVPAEEPSAPANEPAAVASETDSGPFFLDLETGEKTPLPENLVPDGRVFLHYTASPDGTRIAYDICGAPPYCAGTDVLTVANIDGSDARTLQLPDGLNAYTPRWSPDGTKLVYQLRQGGVKDVGNLFLEDLGSGERTQLTDLEHPNAYWWFLSMNFSPDGKNVIYHLPRSSSQATEWDIWSVPVSGGEPTLLHENADFPVYFPDGKEIAVVEPTTGELNGRSIAIASADGSRRTLVEANVGIWFPTMSPDGSRIAYVDGGSVYVVDVATGESVKVADGGTVEWADNDTLIVMIL